MPCQTRPDHTYIHTCIHNITLHYTTLHYITLQYTTLHYTTLHYITLHDMTWHYIHTYLPTYIHSYIHTYIFWIISNWRGCHANAWCLKFRGQWHVECESVCFSLCEMTIATWGFSKHLDRIFWADEHPPEFGLHLTGFWLCRKIAQSPMLFPKTQSHFGDPTFILCRICRSVLGSLGHWLRPLRGKIPSSTIRKWFSTRPRPS